jgi:arylsulfatase A-like enzyme
MRTKSWWQWGLSGAGAVLLASVWWVLWERLGGAMTEGFMPLRASGWAIFLSAALLAQAGGVVLAGIWRLIASRIPARFRALGYGLGWAALVVPPLWWVAQEWSAGEWVKQQSWAGWITPALLIAGGLGALLIGALAHREAARPMRWAALLLGGAAAFMVLDARLFVGLYPDTHLTLISLGGIAALLGALRLIGAVRAPRVLLGVGGLGLLGIAAAGPFLLQTASATRSATMQSSAAAENLLPRLEPRQTTGSLKRALAQLKPVQASAQQARPGFPERPDWNLMLVMVDTLRADALPPSRGDGKPFAQPEDTPNLNAWMQTAFVFERAYSQASRTRYSMPALLRSLHPLEDFKAVGETVGRVMHARGRSAIAILPQYFMVRLDRQVEGITDDFDALAFYEKNDQDALVPEAHRLMREMKATPFFAWVHFYAPHLPGFNGRMLTKQDGDPIARYRMSLRYLDREFGKLLDHLKAEGLADRTIVVLASDHGENLGEKGRFNHGGRVAEQEIRVPLAIHVPGMTPPQTAIKATVGNIDILPTLLDLVGAPPAPAHQGRSLGPLIKDPAAPWSQTYSTVNGSQTLHALIQGTDKWIMRRKTGAIQRFDVGIDPTETADLHAPESQTDQRFAAIALARDRNWARAELKADPQAAEQIVARLKAVTAQEARGLGDGLDFLASLVALKPSPAAKIEVERLLKQGDDDTRLRLIRRLYRTWPKLVGQQIIARLKAASPAEEASLVQGLRRQGQPPFALPFLAERFGKALEAGDAERIQAWLSLFGQWSLPRQRFMPLLDQALKTRSATTELTLILRGVAQLAYRRKSGTADGLLAQQVIPHLTHAEPAVRTAAGDALARLAAPDSLEPIRAALKQETHDFVRRALMRAIVKVGKADAVPDLVFVGQDSMLSIEAIQLIGSLGRDGKTGLPYLKEQMRKHPTGYGRSEARKARNRVLGIKPKKKKKKRRKAKKK